MHKRVLVGQYQKVTNDDFNNFGRFPREAMDILVRDAIDSQIAFVGFPVILSAPAVVTVGAGRFYKNGEMYVHDLEGGTSIDLLDQLPVVAQRIATIVVYGQQVDTNLQPRTFLKDPVTRQTEGRDVATQSTRVAQVSVIYGSENATPSAPTVDANWIAVADVRLSNVGIVEITPRTDGRLRSSRSNFAEIQELQSWRAQNGAAVQTLKTDVSGLAETLRGKANREMVYGMAADLGQVKDQIGLPEDYTAYGGDNYQDEDKSDTDHPDYNALVDDGLFTALVGSQTSHIALLNALDALVETHNSLLLPRFTDVVRQKWVSRDGEHPLTSSTIENVTLEKKTITKTRRVSDGRREGMTPVVKVWGDQGDRAYVRMVGTGQYYTTYRTETYEETYWDEVVTTENVVGANAARTFLNGQEGFLTGVDLYFTRRDTAGPVRVVICETTSSAQPKLTAVLAEVELPQANIKVWPEATPVNFAPVHLMKGRRYAVVQITSGSHFVAMAAGDDAQGSTFFLQEGAWVQDSGSLNIALGLRYAQFDRTRVEVALQPIELAGGISRLVIEDQSIVPEGTSVEFMVRVNGVWKALGEGGGVDIFASRPNLVQLRAVLIGTADLMPALGVGETRTTVTASRAGNSLTHISEALTMPAAVDTIVVTQRISQWDAADHSNTITILTGGTFATVETADAVSDQVVASDPNTIERTATFNLAASQTSFKIKTAVTTSNPAHHPIVASTKWVAFTS